MSMGLVDLPGGSFISTAFAASADASVIVGNVRTGAGGGGSSGFEAFRWDAANGMQELDRVLAGLGVNEGGWTLTNALGVPADGQVIVGYGTNPSGRRRPLRLWALHSCAG